MNSVELYAPGIEWILLYMVLGAVVGFMAGLLGLGGGGILVPLLASIFTYQGINVDNVVHLALGTSLTCMIISSTASIRAHASRGAVEWQVVRGLAPGIILGAFLATQVAAHVNSVYIALFFALFMAIVAEAAVCQLAIKAQPKTDMLSRINCGRSWNRIFISACCRGRWLSHHCLLGL